MQFKAVGGVKINIAVLAYEDSVLWSYRNFLYDFKNKTDYKLGITLTKNPDVIFRGMGFVTGGVDFVMVADTFYKNKYIKFTKTIASSRNCTKIFFIGDGQKDEKVRENVITVSGKQKLEEQLRIEIAGLLLRKLDITNGKS